MRLSVEKNDPGYSDYALYAEVYLNGEKLDNCVTADDSEGYVIVIEKGGKPFARYRKKLYGDVRIAIPEIADQKVKEVLDSRTDSVD